MIDEQKVRKILEELQNEIISLKVTPKTPDDPSVFEGCRIVKSYGRVVRLVKLVPAQMRETVGASEIPFTITTASIEEIHIHTKR